MILTRIVFCILCGAIFGSAYFAAEAPQEKLHKHKKGKFSLRYPSDWKEQVDTDGDALKVSSADEAAFVQVKTDQVKKPLTACEYLARMEAAEATPKANVLPEDKRRPKDEELEAAGVRDGCMGAYRVSRPEGDYLQGAGVYVNGRNVWVIIQNLRAASRDKYGAAIGDIARSFAVK